MRKIRSGLSWAGVGGGVDDVDDGDEDVLEEMLSSYFFSSCFLDIWKAKASVRFKFLFRMK